MLVEQAVLDIHTSVQLMSYACVWAICSAVATLLLASTVCFGGETKLPLKQAVRRKYQLVHQECSIA